MDRGFFTFGCTCKPAEARIGHSAPYASSEVMEVVWRAAHHTALGFVIQPWNPSHRRCKLCFCITFRTPTLGSMLYCCEETRHQSALCNVGSRGVLDFLVGVPQSGFPFVFAPNQPGRGTHTHTDTDSHLAPGFQGHQVKNAGSFKMDPEERDG